MSLVVLSAIIYMLYICHTIYKIKKIPKSLSDTYYAHVSWLFPTVMTLTGMLLLPHWLDVTKDSNLQFLSFLACIGIIFVGTAPDFKNDNNEYIIHMVCAYLAAGFAVVSIVFVMGNWVYIPIILLFSVIYDREFWENKVFHLENSIILSLFFNL